MNSIEKFVNRVICGNCIDVMRQMPAESIDLVMFSPPYYGLRDYGDLTETVWGGRRDCEHEWKDHKRVRTHGYDNKHAKGVKWPELQGRFCVKCGAWKGQLGLEPDWRMYVQHMVEVCREIKRVLKKTGSMYIVLGDTYAGGAGSKAHGEKQGYLGEAYPLAKKNPNRPNLQPIYKPKCLMGIPWRVAFALIEDGWILRNCLIWHKPNAMPSSVKDRFSNTYEFIFFFTKSRKYYFNLDAVRERPKSFNSVRVVSKHCQVTLANRVAGGQSAQSDYIPTLNELFPILVLQSFLRTQRIPIEEWNYYLSQIFDSSATPDSIRMSALPRWRELVFKEETTVKLFLDHLKRFNVILPKCDLNAQSVLGVFFSTYLSHPIESHESGFPITESTKPVSKGITNVKPNGNSFSFDAFLEGFPNIDFIDEPVSLSDSLAFNTKLLSYLSISKSSLKKGDLFLNDFLRNLRTVLIAHKSKWFMPTDQYYAQTNRLSFLIYKLNRIAQKLRGKSTYHGKCENFQAWNEKLMHNKAVRDALKILEKQEKLSLAEKKFLQDYVHNHAGHPKGKNPGDFWSIPTKPYKGAHFAVYPEEICIRPIKASCPEQVCAKCGLPKESRPSWCPSCKCEKPDYRPGIVLDPMCGSGTTLVVAKKLGRLFIGIDINPVYVEMAKRRLSAIPERLTDFSFGEESWVRAEASVSPAS